MTDDIIGTFGGLCNRTACRAPLAKWYNHSTLKYYCRRCANKLNRYNPEAKKRYGHELCTRATPTEKEKLDAEG